MAVYPAINAMRRPMKMDEISPDCIIAQGTDSNDVPIIVFQIAKLKYRRINICLFYSCVELVNYHIPFYIENLNLYTYTVTKVEAFESSPPRLSNVSNFFMGTWI